jgi:hypothetical protein
LLGGIPPGAWQLILRFYKLKCVLSTCDTYICDLLFRCFFTPISSDACFDSNDRIKSTCGDGGFPMMTSSSVYVLFIDDGGYLASVAKVPSDGGQRNQATNQKTSHVFAWMCDG